MRRHFTLIELLVVIVLLLLLSLLYPVFTKAKMLSKVTVSASNYHNIGIADTRFSMANRGWLVPSCEPGGSGKYDMADYLAPYLGFNWSQATLDAITPAKSAIPANDAKTWSCPADSTPVTTNAWRRTYAGNGINNFVPQEQYSSPIYGTHGVNSPGAYGEPKLAQMNDPGQTISMHELTRSGGAGTLGNQSAAWTNNPARMYDPLADAWASCYNTVDHHRMGMRGLFLMVDGSVQQLYLPSIANRNFYLVRGIKP